MDFLSSLIPFPFVFTVQGIYLFLVCNECGTFEVCGAMFSTTVGAHSFINVVFAGHMGVKHAAVGAYCYSVRALVRCVPVGLAGIAP